MSNNKNFTKIKKVHLICVPKSNYQFFWELNFNNNLLNLSFLSFFNNFNLQLKLTGLNSNLFDFFSIRNYFVICFFEKNSLNLIKIQIKFLIENLYKIHYLTFIIRGRNCKFFFSKGYLIIFLGFCHYIYIKIPSYIKVSLVFLKNTKLILKSINKSNLKNFGFFLKKIYLSDPFKGKGIFFANDNVRLKKRKKSEFF